MLRGERNRQERGEINGRPLGIDTLQYAKNPSCMVALDYTLKVRSLFPTAVSNELLSVGESHDSRLPHGVMDTMGTTTIAPSSVPTYTEES